MATLPTGFALAWARTGPVEGGYSNDPADPGGETMYGITKAVAAAFGYRGPMAALPRETAAEIACGVFWTPLSLSFIAAISQPIAEELFDTNFNMWEGFAAKSVQRSLNALGEPMVIDGKIGPLTVEALRQFIAKRGTAGTLVFLRCLNALQLEDYMRQTEAMPAKKKFFFGWVLNRVAMDA